MHHSRHSGDVDDRQPGGLKGPGGNDRCEVMLTEALLLAGGEDEQGAARTGTGTDRAMHCNRHGLDQMGL